MYMWTKQKHTLLKHAFKQKVATLIAPSLNAATDDEAPLVIAISHWLTHWGRDKMAAISQTTLSIAFSWMKMLEFWLNFHWSLFLGVQLTIFQQLVQIMAWRHPGDKPLSEPGMVNLLTHICVTRPQWVKREMNFTKHISTQVLRGVGARYLAKIFHKDTIS